MALTWEQGCCSRLRRWAWAWALGSLALGAAQMCLHFNLRNKVLLLKANIQHMQSLMQTALEGSYGRDSGLWERRGQAGQAAAATWGCKPGWFRSLLVSGKHPGKPAHCSCWKSKENTVLGRAGKTWKCAPLPDNNHAFKRRTSHPSSMEHCCIASAIVQQRKKRARTVRKDLSNKETSKGKCLFLTCGKLFGVKSNFRIFFLNRIQK